LNDFWWLLAVGLIALALCLPFIRYVWLQSDEGVLLHGAQRMFQGDRIYDDFFEFLPPGGFIIVEGWFRIAGISLFSARALAIATIAGIACFTYLACRQASKRAALSAFIPLGWVVMSQGDWTQISHHWFTTLFSMIAAWATLASVQRPLSWSRGPLIAGIAAGAAAMITPHRGALVMLAGATAFLNLRRYRLELTAYVLGSALIPISLIAYLIAQGALTEAFDDVVIFTARRYASIQGALFGLTTNIYQKLLFPLAALVALVACLHNRRKWCHDRVSWTCAAFGLAGFIGCFPRLEGIHIGFAAPLVCPLLAYCVGQLTWRWQPKYRYAAAAFAIASFVPAARWFWWTIHTDAQAEVVSTARGRVSLFPHTARGLVERIAATRADDGYFFYPYMPMLPFLTARRHVAKYDIFVPGYTLPSQYKEACVAAIESATWVVIDRDMINPQVLTAIFPAMRDPEPQETKRFLQALETGFEFVAREGAFEMRRRRAEVDEAVCNRITE
jgi:hypothetical protein